MVYEGTYEAERLVFRECNNNVEHWIALSKAKNEPKFCVTCCCNEDWIWEFWYTKSDYERIKFVVMEGICECDTADELMDELDEVFDEGFDDIVAYEDVNEFKCDGDCDECECSRANGCDE